MGVEAVLGRQNTLGEAIGRVAGENGHRRLRDDGTVVDGRAYDVHCASGNPGAGL
jgi:hypothetical protein